MFLGTKLLEKKIEKEKYYCTGITNGGTEETVLENA